MSAGATTRQALLDAAASIRDVLVASADDSERGATLAPAAVAALERAGLFLLKLPAVLGGAEADPVTQLDVIEAVSAIDASAGWCLMVGATTLALPGVFLADDAVKTVFADGRIPRAAGCYMPTGQAIETAGGYRISGRWAFASGIRHAAWVSGNARVLRDGRPTTERRVFVVPAGEVEVHDNWQVAGLRGTGSCDFSLRDRFVPEAFTWDHEHATPQRGGALYRLGWPAFVANEHAAFALGVARRAVEAVLDVAASKTRGVSPTVLAERPAFQRFVGAAEIRMRAARALAVEVNAAAWAIVGAGERLTPRQQSELRSASIHVNEVCLDVVTGAFRYAGGSAIYDSSVLQRCYRDLSAGGQHFMVSDSGYEGLGQFLLGLPGAEPMR
ncbi:MAG TPA: acyl-CoA dehydrogenase family protein [Methylomirabilota bacterium]|jgi:alkylation response protein AidB-like acyl-CoA dehydrogenase|nr:acyl-CoA dehydrogenase family protein [Methylomirabilota bacterium]